MHSNRTRPERERGWLGYWMRGGLVVGVLLCSGVGARGVSVSLPEEYPAEKRSGGDDAIEHRREQHLSDFIERFRVQWTGQWQRVLGGGEGRSCLKTPGTRSATLPGPAGDRGGVR